MGHVHSARRRPGFSHRNRPLAPVAGALCGCAPTPPRGLSVQQAGGQRTTGSARRKYEFKSSAPCFRLPARAVASWHRRRPRLAAYRDAPKQFAESRQQVIKREDAPTHRPGTHWRQYQEEQQTWPQSVFSSKRRNITLRCTRRPSGARELKRYVSGERGLSYQVSPQWATFTAPAGVRGFRTAPSRWHLSRAGCVAAPPLLRAGCPSRKLAASEPPVRLDANTNSSPLPLAFAYPREPLPHGTATGPGWPPTATHRSSLPKFGSTSSKERMRRLIVLVRTGVSTQEP